MLRLLLPLALVAALAPATAGAQLGTGLDAPCQQVDRVNDSCPVWVGTYGEANDTPGGEAPEAPSDRAGLVLLSGDEQRLYVGGESQAPGGTTYGWAVVAFNPATGERLWVMRLDAGDGAPTALVESPGGDALYVTGSAPRVGEEGTDFVTLTVDPATGDVERERRWHGDLPEATPTAVAVDPSGKNLYVAGHVRGPGTTDQAVVAYDLVEDELRWALERDGGSNLHDLLNDLAISPDGQTLFVTGQSQWGSTDWTFDVATLALDAPTGAVLWERRRDHDGGRDLSHHLVVSPDGSRLFVAASFTQPEVGNPLGQDSQFAVIAYDTAFGTEMFVRRHGGPSPGPAAVSVPTGIAIDDRGERVFMTGMSSGEAQYDLDAATIAVDAVTGALAWEHRLALPGHTAASGVGVAYEPEQDRVYVAAASTTQAYVQTQVRQGRYAAVAIDAGSGRSMWSALYGGHGAEAQPGQALDYDTASGIAVSTASRRLFVAGTFGRRISDAPDEERYAFNFGALAYALPGAGPALPDAGGWHSQNLEFVTHVPTNNDTAGARIVGKYLYVTTSQHLKIYDITDPELPVPVGALVIPGEEVVYLAEEDPDTNGRILLFGPAIVDVTDKANPAIIGTMPRNEHTMSCVLDCTWVYGSGGSIIDIRDPAQPRLAGNWGGGGHDVTEVAPGLILTASNPIKLLDAREDPAHPVLLASAPAEPGQFNHGTLWPNRMADDFFLVGGESGPSTNCSANRSAVLRTFDARGWQEDGEFTKLGSYTVRNGLYTNGDSPADLFCAHWFDVHPSYRNGGLVAMAWYEHGTRLLRVSGEGQIREVGYYIPYGGSTSAAYWATDDIVYSLDYNRGFDILRYTGRR